MLEINKWTRLDEANQQSFNFFFALSYLFIFSPALFTLCFLSKYFFLSGHRLHLLLSLSFFFSCSRLLFFFLAIQDIFNMLSSFLLFSKLKIVTQGIFDINFFFRLTKDNPVLLTMNMSSYEWLLNLDSDIVQFVIQ